MTGQWAGGVVTPQLGLKVASVKIIAAAASYKIVALKELSVGFQPQGVFRVKTTSMMKGQAWPRS